jgi:hypothetical protein
MIKEVDTAPNEFTDEKSWKTGERKGVHVGATALLDSADGTFDFTDVRIPGGKVEGNRENVRLKARKLEVGMDGRDDKTPPLV